MFTANSYVVELRRLKDFGVFFKGNLKCLPLQFVYPTGLLSGSLYPSTSLRNCPCRVYHIRVVISHVAFPLLFCLHAMIRYHSSPFVKVVFLYQLMYEETFEPHVCLSARIVS